MIKKFVKKIVDLFGYRIINMKSQNKNFEGFSSLETFKKVVKLLKDKKLIIFDIGTNHGQFIDLYLNIIKDLSIHDYEIHCFEPNNSLAAKLKESKNPKIFVNNLAITNEIGEKKFLLNDEDQKSSFYNFANYKNKGKEIIVKTTTIDEYCRLKNINKINLIKIDTEGAEPEALEGSKKMIINNKVDCIYSELSIGKLYENRELSISSLEKYLHDKFQLVGISLNRDYYKNEDNKFISTFHSLNQKDFILDLCYLYINKKIRVDSLNK